jgi:hypothetical protein
MTGAVAAIAAVWFVWTGGRRPVPPPVGRATTSNRTPASNGIVRILSFYSSAGQDVAAGSHTNLCYGVENAKSVRIEPPIEDVYPAFSHCVSVEPKHDTTYRLIARGADGREVMESVSVKLTAPPPRIVSVTISSKQIRPGQPLSVCYETEHAASVRLEPANIQLQPASKGCAVIHPRATTKYLLVASARNGPPDRREFTVTVR